jgi:hypothetical protein
MPSQYDTVDEFLEDLQSVLREAGVYAGVDIAKDPGGGRWAIRLASEQAWALGLAACSGCGDQFHEHGAVLFWPPR